MSERGSFVTEYIYCNTCFIEAARVLLQKNKGLCSTTVPTWTGDQNPLPIIAGKLGDTYPGGELNTFEDDLAQRLARVLCHPLRVAVLAEKGEQMYRVIPGQEDVELI